MRVKATIAYNGAKFHGSQVQAKETSVNGTILEALVSMGIDSKLDAAGRTDKDVHATGQVIHFDLPEFWSDIPRFLEILNYKLPRSIKIKKIEQVDDNFHSRFSAKKRVYRYILKEGISNPFEDEFITFHNKLDLETLKKAIKVFEGTHDFACFYKTGGGTKTTQRIMYKTLAYEHKGYTVLYFEANGFLRSQIRMMVAFLLGINDGRYTIADLKERLLCKKRKNIKPAPANGLYLAKIFYS